MRRVTGIGLLVVLALTLAGCGGEGDADATGTRGIDETAAVQDTGSDGPAPAATACPLTADQVTATLGIDMVQNGTACAFVAFGATFAEAYYSNVSSDVFAADEPTAVDGVGDKAYLGPSDELYVRAGDLAFSVHVLASEISSGIDGDAAQIELARLVIDGAG